MSTLAVGTIKSVSSAAPVFQNTSGTEKGQLAKAWVNFNGTGTVAMRDNFNVSTVTDNGTGDYTINFTNAFANANYAMTGSSGGQNSTSNGAVYQYEQASAKTTSAARVLLITTAGGIVDTPHIAVAFFGDN